MFSHAYQPGEVGNDPPLVRLCAERPSAAPVFCSLRWVGGQAPRPGSPVPYNLFRGSAPSLEVRPTFADLRLLRLGATSAPTVAPPAPGFYLRGLLKAEARAAHALADSTISRQDGFARELGLWLGSLGEEGVDLLTVTPEYILVFVEEHWLPNHPGRKQGEAGPSAVKGLLSALSGWFERVGRSGAYDAATGKGNPCTAISVSDYRKGYERLKMLGGYEETSAVPLTAQKYEQLCSYLLELAGAAVRPLSELLALRDLLCAQYMWESTMRGHDVGKLALADFCDPAEPAKPERRFPLPPPWEWAAEGPGFELCVREWGTKTYRLGRAPAVPLKPNWAKPALCFPRVLAYYMWRCRQPDVPGCTVTGYLLRPLTPDRQRFREEPLSSAAMGARVRRHLMAAGLYAGETNHSFRRGALQAAAGAGQDVWALLSKGQLRSSETLKRYLDPHRHEAGREGKCGGQAAGPAAEGKAKAGKRVKRG